LGGVGASRTAAVRQGGGVLAAWALCSQSVNACGSRWANTSSNAARVSSRRSRSPGQRRALQGNETVAPPQA